MNFRHLLNKIFYTFDTIFECQICLKHKTEAYFQLFESRVYIVFLACVKLLWYQLKNSNDSQAYIYSPFSFQLFFAKFFLVYITSNW